MCSCWNVQSSSAIENHIFHKWTVNAAYSDMMCTVWTSLETNVTAVHQRNRKDLKHQFIKHLMSRFFSMLFNMLFFSVTMRMEDFNHWPFDCKSSHIWCLVNNQPLFHSLFGSSLRFLVFLHDRAHRRSILFITLIVKHVIFRMDYSFSIFATWVTFIFL